MEEFVSTHGKEPLSLAYDLAAVATALPGLVYVWYGPTVMVALPNVDVGFIQTHWQRRMWQVGQGVPAAPLTDHDGYKDLYSYYIAVWLVEQELKLLDFTNPREVIAWWMLLIESIYLDGVWPLPEVRAAIVAYIRSWLPRDAVALGFGPIEPLMEQFAQPNLDLAACRYLIQLACA